MRLLIGLVLAGAFVACGTDDPSNFAVDYAAECNRGCESVCVPAELAACTAGCEKTWAWTATATVAACGKEYAAMEAGCQSVKRCTVDGALYVSGDDACRNATAVWNACIR